MNSKAKGNLSEIKIISRLIELGYIVSLPFGDNARYDLIFDDGEKLNRVQVKTARLKPKEEGKIIFATTSSQGHRGKGKQNYKNDVEYFGVYLRELDQTYLIPIEDATSSDMTLRLKGFNFRSEYNAKYADDYIL